MLWYVEYKHEYEMKLERGTMTISFARDIDDNQR